MPTGYSYYNQHRPPTSDETKELLRLSHLGKKHTLEANRNNSLAQLRMTNKLRVVLPEAELYDLYITQGLSETNIAQKYSYSPPTVHKNLGYYNIPVRSFKEALNLSLYKAKMSVVMKGKQNSKGYKHTEQFKQKIRQAQRWHLEPFQRDKRLRALRLGSHIRPNKPETRLIELLNKHYPNQYKYVGDGKVTIEGFNPDFINVNGKKHIIEVFGTYWHNNKDTTYERTEKGRIELFHKYGYRTLVIWESEFADEQKLLSKIQNFEQMAINKP